MNPVYLAAPEEIFQLRFGEGVTKGEASGCAPHDDCRKGEQYTLHVSASPYLDSLDN